MSTTQQNQEEDVIDLKELFFYILVNWPIILLTTILSVAAAVFYLKVTLPTYSVNAMLQVESKSAGTDLFLGDIGGFDGKSEVQTEIEILKSRMILNEVAKNLNLNIGLSPFYADKFDKATKKSDSLNVSYDTNGVAYQSDKVTLLVKNLDVSDGFYDKNLILTLNSDKTYQLKMLEGDVELFNEKGKSGETLTIQKDDETLSLDIVFDTLTRKTFNIARYSELTSTSSLASKLSASEKGKRTGILSLGMQGTDKDTIVKTLNEIIDIYVAQNLAKKSAEKEKTIEFLDNQLPDIKNKLELAEAKFNEFRKQNETVDVEKESQIMLEQSVQLGRTKLELEQKLAELSARFTDEYPVLQQVKTQLKLVDSEIITVNKRLKQLPLIQQEYLKLYRDVEINTQLYTNLLESYQKLKIAKSGELGNVRIIDKAVKPNQYIKPKKKLVILLSIILGLFAGVALALARKLFNNGLKDSSQIESITGIPVLANVPTSKLQNKLFRKLNRKSLHQLVFLEDPEDMAIEALRSLRTALFFATNQSNNNIIMITGPSPGIGKSFVSANLAAVLASSGKKVALLDGDLRRGYLHKIYGEKNTNGLSDYIRNNTDTVMKQTLIKDLELAVRGKNVDNPAEILMSEKFEKLVKKLSAENDYVLIDSPPTLAVTDSTIIGSLAGSTLVIARYGLTHIQEVKLTNERLKASGANVVGFVFNDVKKEPGSYYNYQYGYNYKSK